MSPVSNETHSFMFLYDWFAVYPAIFDVEEEEEKIKKNNKGETKRNKMKKKSLQLYLDIGIRTRLGVINK